MSEPLFSARPHVPLLQWLGRGSLKQNLPRAIRLWVWLCYLYGSDNDGEPFSFGDLPYSAECPSLSKAGWGWIAG